MFTKTDNVFPLFPFTPISFNFNLSHLQYFPCTGLISGSGGSNYLLDRLLLLLLGLWPSLPVRDFSGNLPFFCQLTNDKTATCTYQRFILLRTVLILQLTSASQDSHLNWLDEQYIKVKNTTFKTPQNSDSKTNKTKYQKPWLVNSIIIFAIVK